MTKKIFFVFIILSIGFLFLFTTESKADHAGETCNVRSGPVTCSWRDSTHTYCKVDCKLPWIYGDCSAGDRLNCIDATAECTCNNPGIPCHRGNGVCRDSCNSNSDCADTYACTNVGRPGEPTVCWKSSCDTQTTPTPALNPPTGEFTVPSCIAKSTPYTFSGTCANCDRMGIYQLPLANPTWSPIADTQAQGCNPYTGNCSGTFTFNSTGDYYIALNAYKGIDLKCTGNPGCTFNGGTLACTGYSDCHPSKDGYKITVVDSCAPSPPTCTVTVPGCIAVGIPALFSGTCNSPNCTRMGIYKSSVPYPTGGQTWQEIAGSGTTAPGCNPYDGTGCDGSFTFNSIGQHEIVCNAYNDNNGLKCTGNPWCYDANNNWICSGFTDCTSADRYTINVVQSCQPPTITPTTPPPPPPSTITPTQPPPPPPGCENFGVDEHSGSLSNLIGIKLTPTKVIRLLNTLNCNSDERICDAEGMDNYGTTVYLVANEVNGQAGNPSIYTVDKTSGALTLVRALTDKRRYEGLSFRPGDASNFVWGGSPNSGQSPGIYKINLSYGSSKLYGGENIYTKSITWNLNGTILYVSTRTHLLKFDYVNDTLTQDPNYSIPLPGGNTDAMDMTDDGYIVGSYKSSGELIFYFLNPVVNPAAGAQAAQVAGSLHNISLTNYNNQLASSGSSFNNLDAFVWLCGNNPTVPSPTTIPASTGAITANINPASLSNAGWEAMINDSLSGTCDASCLSRRISETFSCHVPGLQKQTCDPTRGECQTFTPPCYFQDVGTPI